MPPEVQQALIKAAVLDAVCVAAGVGLFLATGNWIWLLSGVLLGAGFLLPAVITLIRARK